MKPHVLLILQSPFEECAAIFKGFMQYQRSNRPWVVSLDNEVHESDDWDLLRSQQWQAVVSRHTTLRLIQTCADLRLPLVDLTDTPAVPGVIKIRTDNVAIGHVAAEYFIDRKFRYFGFCGWVNCSVSIEREAGFIEALKLAGYSCNVFREEGGCELGSELQAQDSPTALDAWVAGLPAGSGVMTCDDLRAVQVIRASQSMGREVPEELAVLGANNDSMRCEMIEPSLSSVALDSFEVGLKAAEQLARWMAGETTAVPEVRVEPAGVVSRNSTDILALRDEKVARAVDYIREHACRGVTVDDVLGHVIISRSQLEHKFRRFVGRSPQVEIRRVQVEKIRQLLRETTLPLKDIADVAGFTHVEYMSVVFKRLTGETPGHYRKRVQTNELIWATT